MNVLLTLFYIIGFSVYLVCKKFVLFYYIIWLAFFPYLLSFVVFDVDQVKFISGQANYFIATIFIINTIRFKNYLFSIKGVLILVLISALLLLSSIINSVPLNYYIHFAISFLLPVYCFSSILQSINNLQLTSFINFLFFMVFIEVSLCFIQYNYFIGISPTWLLSVGGFANSNYMWGTFSNCNIVSMFISLNYLAIMCMYDKNWSFFRKVIFVLLSIGVWWCIMFSGIRTYLLLLVASCIIVLFLKTKNKIILSVMLVIGTVLFLSTFIVSDYEQMESADKEAGIERQIYGISKIANGDEEGSTLYLSTYLLKEYYNPFDVFGKGLLYTKGYGLVSLDNNNETDATLALYLVEFGMITLSLFIYYLYYQTTIATRRLKHRRSAFVKLLFFFCLFSTITDPGVFIGWSLLIIAIYSKLDDQFVVNQKYAQRIVS